MIQAKAATQTSYSPYSHFCVGAALRLENGVVVCGSNQENAAYPAGSCAERTAMFYANAQYPDVAPVCIAIAVRLIFWSNLLVPVASADKFLSKRKLATKCLFEFCFTVRMRFTSSIE